MNAWLALYPKSIEALLILQQENKQWLCNEFGHTHCIQNQALEILPPLIIHSNLRGPQDWLVNARQKLLEKNVLAMIWKVLSVSHAIRTVMSMFQV
jgi:hypothetical protein